jgi:two-component system chemotaxis sensor kinase CheA
MLERDSEMRNIFLGELKDLIEKISENLKILSAESVNSGAIDKIFQAIHTLKGMFASVDFLGAAETCHIAEDAMIHLKKINYVDSDTADILLEFVDKFEAIYTQFESFEGSSEEEQEKFYSQFDFSMLKKNLTSITGQELNLGSKMSIVVKLDPSCKLKGARAFQVLTGLEDVAKILDSKPSRHQIEEGDAFDEMHITIVTQDDEDSIKARIENVDEIASVIVETIFDESSLEDKEVMQSGGKGALQTIRVQLSLIDQLMDLLGELVIERNALSQQLAELGVNNTLFTQMDRTIYDLRRLILKTRLVPLEYIFDSIPRIVRDSVKNTDKRVKPTISGKFVEIDRTSVENLNEALLHLIRNAIYHGIESPKERKEKSKPEEGLLQIKAKIDRNDIIITVEDDGKGIDVEKIKEKAIKENLITADQKIDREGIIALLFLSGFSTSDKVTSVAGRGVGLNIVYQNIVEKLNGNINVETKKGKGTRFTIRIPTQISIMEALVVKIEGRDFTIPLSNIQHVYRLPQEKLFYHNGKPNVVINREVVPVISLKDQFNIKETSGNIKNDILIIWEQAGRKLGVQVDQIVNQQQIVLKKMDRLMSNVKGFAGFTLIGEGNIVPILDPGQLIGAV